MTAADRWAPEVPGVVLAALSASTTMSQAATPAPAPTLADRAATATARASAQIAVIGMSQANVSWAAWADAVVPMVAALAASPSTAFTANTVTALVSSTIRSLTAQLQDSSQAGSTPGP